MHIYKLQIVLVSYLLIIFFVLGNAAHSSGTGVNSPLLETFTVKEPTSKKWINKSKPKHLIYGKSIGEKFSTFTLEAHEYPTSPEPIKSISSLLNQLKKLFEKRINNQNNGRYEMTSHSEEIRYINNLACVEYQRSWVDHGSGATQNTELIMLATGYICIHPESTSQLIEVSYSSRNNSGHLSPEAKAEGEYFINSVKAVTAGKQNH